MSTLSKYNTLLSTEMGDSEGINKTPEQRNQAINFAVQQIFEYRNWKDLYKNTTIQTVDGVANIPFSMGKPTAIWYGKTSNYYLQYNWVNQTDFFTKFPATATITELNGAQVIRLEDDQNRGHAVSNLVGDSVIGINDIAARERNGQTFVMLGENIEGCLVKLSKVGLPTGTLTLDIFATVAGLPTGSSLDSSIVNIKQITTNELYIWFQLTKPLSVIDGDTLAITITPSYTTSATDYVQWNTSPTSQVAGEQILFDGATWSTGTGDNVFVVCNDYYNFQYTANYQELIDPSDESGLNSSFDQAVGKYSAGILYETKSQYDKSGLKFHGGTGEDNPTGNSAYGILNRLWTTTRTESMRTNRRLRTVFDRVSNGRYNRGYSYQNNYRF